MVIFSHLSSFARVTMLEVQCVEFTIPRMLVFPPRNLDTWTRKRLYNIWSILTNIEQRSMEKVPYSYFRWTRFACFSRCHRFCIEYDIEMVCIPPYSGHRQQPLDTHFNAVLKLGVRHLKSFERLGDCEVAAITPDNFVTLFCDVLKEMQNKRGSDL